MIDKNLQLLCERIASGTATREDWHKYNLLTFSDENFAAYADAFLAGGQLQQTLIEKKATLPQHPPRDFEIEVLNQARWSFQAPGLLAGLMGIVRRIWTSQCRLSCLTAFIVVFLGSAFAYKSRNVPVAQAERPATFTPGAIMEHDIRASLRFRGFRGLKLREMSDFRYSNIGAIGISCNEEESGLLCEVLKDILSSDEVDTEKVLKVRDLLASIETDDRYIVRYRSDRIAGFGDLRLATCLSRLRVERSTSDLTAALSAWGEATSWNGIDVDRNNALYFVPRYISDETLRSNQLQSCQPIYRGPLNAPEAGPVFVRGDVRNNVHIGLWAPGS